MRLFTAIDLPDEMIWKLERLLSVLRPEAIIKWSPIDNLHITTKFIGEWPPSWSPPSGRIPPDGANGCSVATRSSGSSLPALRGTEHSSRLRSTRVCESLSFSAFSGQTSISIGARCART